MRSIDSHIQPRFFLKGFAAQKQEENHDDFLYVYKKGFPFKTDGPRKQNNPAKTGLDKVAFAKNFYAFLRDNGTEDREHYENKLSVEIENPGNPVLRKLRSIELAKHETIKLSDFLTDAEKSKFARYIAAMCSRSKRNLQWYGDATERTRRKAMEQGFRYSDLTQSLTDEEKERHDAWARSIDPDFDPENGFITFPEEIIDIIIDNPTEFSSFPATVFHGINALEPLILSLKWQVRLTPPAHRFFSGDDPIFWTNLKQPNPVILFPIATNAIFVASGDRNFFEGIYLDSNYKFLSDVRECFRNKCSEIYCSFEARWLASYFK